VILSLDEAELLFDPVTGFRHSELKRLTGRLVRTLQTYNKIDTSDILTVGLTFGLNIIKNTH